MKRGEEEGKGEGERGEREVGEGREEGEGREGVVYIRTTFSWQSQQ